MYIKKIILIVFILSSSCTLIAQEKKFSSVYIKTEQSFNKKGQNTVFRQLLNSGSNFRVLTSENLSSKKINGSSLIHARIPEDKVKETLVQLKAMKGIRYAKENITFQLLDQPNDPFADSTASSFSGQWILRFHDLYKAWDIEKGDSTITIGIVDSGLDSSNADLLANIQVNPLDPIDGINNEGDSLWGQPLLDNYAGWDVGDWDNNVTNKIESHGTKVAGVSSARTNNGTGIAGVGYKCKFLPIKATTDEFSQFITHGYDGLLYAALKGCQVINLSWGSTLADPEVLQDLIDYIVNDLDCIVVAAAGNSDLDEKYYPASLNNVISVTGIKNDNIKQGKSTYNYAVELCAVGQFVRTTFPNNEFKIESGTSMAAPVVSGAAALLKSHFPSWSSKQITEQLRVTADIIDTLPNNLAYRYKLGKKVNVYRALSDTLKPALRVSQLSIPNYPNFNKDGELISFSPELINYRHAASDITVSLEIIEGNSYIVDSSFFINGINTLEVYSNPDSLLSFFMQSSNDTNEYIVLKINYSGPGFEDYEIIELNFEPSTLTSNSSFNNATISSESLTIFPNPVQNNIKIQSSIKFNTIHIYNSLGETVLRKRFIENKKLHSLKNLNLDHGVYLIEVKNKFERLTSKLAK